MLLPPTSVVGAVPFVVGDNRVRLDSGCGLPENVPESAGLTDPGGGAGNEAPTSGEPPKLLNPPTFIEVGGIIEVKL